MQHRSSWKRVFSKTGTLQTWERQTESGMTKRADGTEFEPTTENERDHLAHLIELRGVIRQELIEHGQIEA